MAWKFSPYLVAAAFAAILFRLLSRGGDQARSTEESASGNDGTAGGASSTDASTEGQEVATSSGHDYEVFLSFRGPDTRAGFTDFLYTSLKDAGIHTFRDDEELRIGENFAPELLQAIKQSKISIPIFSKGYASSPWCLKELVQMVERQKNGRQKIMPIFYDVAPSEVRHQIGGYAEAFLTHKTKNRHDEKTRQEWMDALSVVGAINGWNLFGKTNRREGEFAKEVTEKVFKELKKALLVVSDCLVSVDNQVGKIMAMIGAQPIETRIIGIHGMGGIGKTTIAKIIYNQLSSNFEDCCFLSNIRETSKVKGIACLQNQLISNILKVKQMDINNEDQGIETIKNRLYNKRVLLLLDDVEKVNHIDAFVGKRDWFGKGSKIIITTRNEDILHVPNVDQRYKVECMDHDQSLQLFSKHAFRRDYPLDKDMVQSNRAICIARGLPLALEVIGSLLCRIEKKKWDGKLKELENVPPEDVLSKLKISYEALRDHEQRIFLDIACLFIGYEKDLVIYFWDESIYSPKEAMDVLENMSLIKINDYNQVLMHDQLRDLGREIIRRESNQKIEKQSRVWDPKQGSDFMRRPKENKEVEALRVKFDNEQQYHFIYKGFESLTNLRFLEVNGRDGYFRAKERLHWHKLSSDLIPTSENSDLLPQLRWLSWHYIPPTFNITNFSMENVAILDLSDSHITDDWMGWSHMKVMKNLKVLDMSHCSGFQTTPNFSTLLNLERLVLNFCQSLIKIDRSICRLTCLVSLDVSRCESLLTLPDELGVGLASLEYLYLKGCTSLLRLPNSIGSLTSLIKLDISDTSIKKLPDSFKNLKNLKVVKMCNTKLTKIPDDLLSKEDLQEVVASGDINKIRGGRIVHVQIGNGICWSQSLRSLILNNVDIYALSRLPESLTNLEMSILWMDTIPDLSNLTNLEKMDLYFRRPHHNVISNGLGEHSMPLWLGNLSKLEFLALRFLDRTTLPTDLSPLPQLKSLCLQCPNMCRLPTLPSSLSSLNLKDCKSLCSMGDLSNLKTLSSLHISSATIADIQGLSCLENLRDLALCLLGQVKILPDLSNFNKLTSFHIQECDKLVEIQGQLPLFLDIFDVRGCGSLQKLPDLSSLMGKRAFVVNCKKLNVETILNVARLDPRKIEFEYFEQLQILPDLSNSNELKCLHVRQCDNLVEIQGKLPQSLEVLKINSCKSLRKLPNLLSSTGLREVRIYHCDDLVEIQGELPQSLEVLEIDSCKSLGKLPNLSSLTGLREVRIDYCDDLVEIQGELPQSLEKLVISKCVSLQKLPYLSKLDRIAKDLHRRL